MVRTGSAKGKEIATTSSQAPPRKRRQLIQEESEDEQMSGGNSPRGGDSPPGERLPTDPVTGQPLMCPPWNAGILSNHHPRWQPQLFRQKMAKNNSRKDGFLLEKEVPEDYFKEFGITGMFKALGWSAALKCYDGKTGKVYMDQVEEWVATLRKEGQQGPGMKLIGTVEGVEITMSLQTLRSIAAFDSRPRATYIYPTLNDLYFEPEKHTTWNMMIQRLFVPGHNTDKLLKKDLKIEAKLLLVIIQQNVIPRRGDKEIVRYPEVPILYALLTGEPLVSYRYLVMNNIWLSRDSLTRRFIPHCRLITALIKRAGMITDDTPAVIKRQPAFDLRKLGSNWEFKESGGFYKLKIRNQKWKVPIPGARPLGPGEEDEPSTEDEAEESGDDEYEERTIGGGERQQGDTSGGGRGRAGPYDYATRQFDQNWAYSGSLQEVIRRERPEAYYHWPETAQVPYDHATYMGASQERSLKRMEDRMEQWNRTHAYNYQQEINLRYQDDRNRRMHDQWHAQQPIVPDPPIIDYQQLPPYDGVSPPYPTPPIHHSMWVDPNQPRQPEEGSSQSGAFGFGEMESMMNSIFGPPRPPYY